MTNQSKERKPYAINALPKSIGEILSSPRKMRVPLYQRDFSWGSIPKLVEV